MTKPLALIIEDNPKLGEIYEVVLQQSGYDTELITRGDEAWPRLEKTEPALILLDIHLPYVSGEEILQRIRADRRLSLTPVIVLTADLYLAKSLASQTDHVLVKSAGVAELRALAERLRPSNAASQPD